jgi:FAD/FMN-containing dehydrogenase
MKPVRYSSSRRAFLHRGAALAGSAAALNRAPLAGAAARQARPLIYERGQSGYEAMRASLCWQAMKPERYPRSIVEVTSADDVAAALARAKADRLRVSMVSSGHSYVGTGIRGDAILLHMGNLLGAKVDEANRTASLQPGVCAVLFDALLAQHNLAFPIAHNAQVGMAGFLLGGGMGWNAESWNNFACFHLRALEAVLATGETVVVDSEHHPDLFWAARGGGPCFPAVVTRFDVDVFPCPAAIRETTLVYAMEAAPSVIAWLERNHAAMNPKMELTLIFATDDQGKAEKQCIVSAIVFADDEDEAKRIYGALAEGAPTDGVIFREELAPRTFRDLLLEDKASVPIRHAVNSIWTQSAGETARVAARQFLSAPTAKTLVYVNYRSRPTVPSGGACSVIGPAFVFCDVSWDDEKDDAASSKWADDFVAAMSAIENGFYVNEVDFVQHPERLSRCYSQASWKRLKEVVARYDPQRLFASPLNP